LTRRAHEARRPQAQPMIDSVRQAFLAALAAMEPNDLVTWGKAHPNQFFALLLKLIPESELRGADFADVSDTPIDEGEWTARE
jgi:hypothetical protein